MKIFIIILCLSVSAFTQEEYQDEFDNLEAYNNNQNETNHPEIEDNYEEATFYNNKNETNHPEIEDNYEDYNNNQNETNTEDNYEEATFYRPNTWDFWVMDHIIETVLWSILLLMTVAIIGLACCLFDFSRLFFSLLMNEVEPQIIPLVPVQHVRFQV